MDLPGALASSIPAVVAVPALLPDWLNAETLMSNLGTFAFWAALAIIFAECGLFVFFMPGDSLLFVVGMFIATGAIVGGTLGAKVGRRIPPVVLRTLVVLLGVAVAIKLMVT